MWSIEMFPAAQGDSLWIEYGDAQAPNRILIDGGTSPTYDHLRTRLDTLDPGDRHFELLVVTHVDADHIEGMVRLLGDSAMKVVADDIWFNGWKHIADTLGPVQGEYLSALIDKTKTPWNHAFDDGPVVIREGEPLPPRSLAGGMKLTVLSPRIAELKRLAGVWKTEVEKAGLAPGVAAEALDRLERDARLRPPPDVLGAIDIASLAEEPFEPDRAEANSSSIVLLAEFEGKACLLGADGVTGVLDATVPILLDERNVTILTLDALKLPHHGSKHNTNNDLVSRLPARRYLFSSSGAIFGHPDQIAVSRVLVRGAKDPELIFNYRSADNEMWDDEELKTKFGYRTRYPEPGALGIRVDL